MAVAVTVASAVVLVAAAALGWPGTTVDCAPDGCYCEAAHPGPIRQPVNTLSALGFVAVGLAIGWHASRTRPAERFADPRVLALYAGVVVFLGPGAMFFHASLVEWGGRLDAISMILFIAFALFWDIARAWDLSERAFLTLYGVGAGGCAAWFALFGGSSIPLFGALVAGTCLLEILLVVPLRRLRLGRRREVHGPRRYLLVAVGCFAVALAVWVPSRTGGPLCDPTSLWQGHALWHLLSAGSAGAVYLYFLGEPAALPDTPDAALPAGPRPRAL